MEIGFRVQDELNTGSGTLSTRVEQLEAENENLHLVVNPTCSSVRSTLETTLPKPGTIITALRAPNPKLALSTVWGYQRAPSIS